MAPPSIYSAIDDHFAPDLVPPTTLSDYSSSAFNGARSGHWTVPSRSSGAIDDQCPTIWGVTAIGDDSSFTGKGITKPIDHELLKQLSKVAIKQKQTTDSVTPGAVASFEETRDGAAETVTPLPPVGFYLPTSLPKGSVRYKLHPSISEIQSRKEPLPAHEPASVFTQQQTTRASKPRTTIDEGHRGHARPVKIKGKHGQEAVIFLPTHPKITTETASTKAKQPRVDQARMGLFDAKVTGQESTARIDTARSAANSMPREGSASKPEEPVRRVYSACHKAPSVTQALMTSPKSLQEAVPKVTGNSTRLDGHGYNGVEVAGIGYTKPAAKGLPKRHHRPSKDGFQPVGHGWTSPPVVQPKSGSMHPRQAQSHILEEHSFDGNNGFADFGPPRPRQSRQSPTVFAGRGWVSPHPLSVSATDRTLSPQSHITLPAAGSSDERQLSYENFMVLKSKLENVDGHDSPELRHCNISCTASIISAKALDLAKRISRTASVARTEETASSANCQSCHRSYADSDHTRWQSRRVPSERNDTRHSNGPQSQHVRWSPSVRNDGAEGAEGWHASPGTASNGMYEDNTCRSDANRQRYRQFLEGIMANERQSKHAVPRTSRTGEIQLSMPWDGRVSTAVSEPDWRHNEAENGLPDHFTW